jgi:DNA (cytosine-5)-methyltransferase 1
VSGEIIDLCAGYGGLSMGLSAVSGAQVTAYAEVEPAALAILERHHPHAAALGDVKTLDWERVAGARWFCAGYPCQPFSDAGRKLGFADPRHIWPWIARGIAIARPDFVLLENVRGHVKLGLREVLADLTDMGYGGAWGLFAASDVGAPHQRYRVFILASRHVVPGFVDVGKPGPAPFISPVTGALLPTPEAKLANSGPDYARMSRPNSGGHDLTTAVTLLPTPRASDVGTPGRRAGEGYRPPLSQVIFASDARGVGSSATPRASDGPNGGPNQRGSSGDLAMPSVVHSRDWEFGKYAPAVARWEAVTGTTAPPAKILGAKGGERLNPRFAEWMMGVPAGHICDVIDGSSAQLKAIGNGVVPLQASYAVGVLMRHLATLPRATRSALELIA